MFFESKDADRRDDLSRHALLMCPGIILCSLPGIVLAIWDLIKYGAEARIITVVVLVSTVAFIAAVTLYLMKYVLRPFKELDSTIDHMLDGLNKEHFADFIHATEFRDKRIGDQINDIFHYAKNSANREYANELLKKKAEYMALQRQINPHFLYNALESIRGQALIDGVPQIAKAAGKLSSFFRYNIGAKEDFVPLSEEIKNVQDYFYIQQFRFEDRFELQILCDQDSLDQKLPRMTLQPLVENSIHHGLESKTERGCVTIRAMITERHLLITVSDNGCGMSQETTELLNDRIKNVPSPTDDIQTDSRHSGIALSNINQRIKLCFGPTYGLHISSAPDLGTEIQLSLPRISIKEMHAFDADVNSSEA